MQDLAGEILSSPPTEAALASRSGAPHLRCTPSPKPNVSDLFARLQDALSDRYALEQQLGEGGMASVYLARDLRHDREVAIKVIRPELSAFIGPERFLREIETTARLTHPGILPLFDSGDADGILWYAMPYFAGRTLKDRLASHGPLSLAEALGIFRDVAGALEYAHRHGVVHRDLKPANVLLQDSRAVLADFGIALPMGGSTARLTETGLSVGTPEYMSPEQALGQRNLDARSDIYALGCLLYQMLAGEPPFTGTTPQAVIAKRLVEPVPRLSTVRDVPRPVEAAITKALSRQPADRFDSVAEFVRAVEATDAPTIPSPDAPSARRWLQPRLIASLLLVVVAGVVALRARRAPSVRFDPTVVAVMPARINAPGHSLEYLKEGILDLAATRLTGEGGPRAADPRATLAALRSIGEDNAAALADRLGAGKVLDESIVGDGQHLTLTATLISYPGGGRQAPVSVEGSEDSLGVLVDRLMIRVLALHAGERTTALAQITSLPAWRAYLEGKAAYRAGRYEDAVRGYEQALTIDSTFTLAALADLQALDRSSHGSGERARMVLRDLHRLSSDDSLWFFALQGPHYPEASRVRDQIAALELAARRLPDRADAWFELGDMQLHAGGQVDLDSAFDLAKQSFSRALALDSSFALPIDHLLLIAYSRSDTSAVRRLTALYLVHDSLGDRSAFYRWRSALALGDSASVARLRPQFPALSDQSLRFIIASAQEDGVGVGDAVLADSVLRSRAASEPERQSVQLVHGILMLNLGRSTAPPIGGLGVPIDNALFSDGDTLLALPAVREIRARLKTPHPPVWYHRWELACWDLMHGDSTTARAFVADFRAHVAPDLRANGDDDAILAPGLLDAWTETHTHSAKAEPLLRQLDSLFGTGPISDYREEDAILLGRLFSALGQPEQALRALRRVDHFLQWPYASNTTRLARARAAVAAGRKEEAIQSYRIYLALRSDPDPRLVPQRDSARAELAGLLKQQ